MGKGKYEFERRNADEIKQEKQKHAELPSHEVIVVKPRKFGASFLLDQVFTNSKSGLALSKVVEPKIFNRIKVMIMTVIMYRSKSLSCECNNFLKDHDLGFDDNIDKDTIQRVYSYLSENGIVDQFFKQKRALMVRTSGFDNAIFLAIDSTNHDISGKHIVKAQYGKSKSGKNSKTFNVINIFEQNTHELFNTSIYAGGVPDVLSLESICRQSVAIYGKQKLRFVLCVPYNCLGSISVDSIEI